MPRRMSSASVTRSSRARRLSSRSWRCSMYTCFRIMRATARSIHRDIHRPTVWLASGGRQRSANSTLRPVRDSLRWFRERGVRMSELLLGGLDTTRAVGREQLIAQAEILGREYGVEAKRRGLSLGEATQAFLFFRARFMAEIANVARRRALASEQASLQFEEADRALDRVILALIAGHQTP